MSEILNETTIENIENKPKNKARNIILGIVLLGILVVAGFVVYRQQNHKKSADSGLQKKERNLSQEAQKIYSDRIKKAEEDLKTANPKNPDFQTREINDHMYLAQQYFGLGLLEESKQQYLEALKFDVKNEAALVGLAYTYTDAGELASAQNLLESAILNNPKNYNLWLQLIDVEKSVGVTNQEVEKTFERAVAATNSYPDVLTRYAQFEETLGNFDKAISLWQEAAKQNLDGIKIYDQEISRLKLLKK